MSSGVAGLVLAAGASTRFEGGSKLLVLIGGEPVVAATVRAALEAGLDPVVVVVGRRAAEVRAALEGLGSGGACSGEARTGRLRFVRVPDPAGGEEAPDRHPPGQGTSVAAGIGALAADDSVEAAAVLLADEPGIDPADIRSVVDAWHSGATPVVRARYLDRPGHPVVFGRSWFGRLARLAGEAGAAPLLAARPGEVAEVRLEREAPVDVDTRGDYRRASRPGR